MYKRILSLFVLALCVVGHVSASVYVPSQLYTSGSSVGAGTFYFYNIGANRYLSRGTSWDTHAILDGAGLPIRVDPFGNGGSLYTGVNSKYLGLVGDGVWMDRDQTEFVCEAVTVEGYTNAYKLKCTVDGTTYYLGWAGGGEGLLKNEVVTTTSNPSNNNYYWLLISPNDRKFDVTNYVTNPDFERGNVAQYPEGSDKTTIRGWANGGFTKNFSSQDCTNAAFVEKWAQSAPLGGDNIHQNLSNLPAGIYTVTITGKATKSGSAATKGVNLFLGEHSTPIGASGTYSVTTTLPNGGSLDLGVGINADNDANWVVFDNVRLYREDIAKFNIDKNTLTFTGAGRLEDKTFNMTDYTLTLGNENEEGEVPYVRYLDNASEGLVAYVKDRNGYSFANISNNLPTGWGTYYVIRPKTDGRLKVWVRGYHDDNPLVLIDSHSKIRKEIPGAEYNTGVTLIDCGNLIGGETYYLYSKGYGTLFMQKSEYTSISSLYSEYGSGFNIVEYNDFDQYSESLGTHIWVKNTTLDCTAEVDAVAGNTHGPYAYYDNSGNTSGERSVLYEFEQLGARKRYVMEFDACIRRGNTTDSQIALYRTKPSANAQATDYLLSIIIPGSSGDWQFYVPGISTPILTANLQSDPYKSSGNYRSEWYHFIVNVDARTENQYKLGVKVTADDDHSNVLFKTEDASGEFASFNFTGDYKALGLSYLAGKGYNTAKFDNILICSNQGNMGSVTAPTIAVTGFSGNSRNVTITSGYSENEFTVKTYYQYTTDTSKNWDNILGDGSWTSWTNFDVAPNNQPGPQTITLSAESKTVYLVRAISTITDYATVRSDTAYLRVPVGEVWTLTGGFEVQEMKQETDGYYTPKIRAYADTGILGTAINQVNIQFGYYPLDYGIDASTGEFVERAFVELVNGSATDNSKFTTENGITYFDVEVPRSGNYWMKISGSGFITGIIEKNYYKDKYKVTYQTPDFANSEPLTEFQVVNGKYIDDNSDQVLNRIYGYTGWVHWEGVQKKLNVEGWNNDGVRADYIWNYSTKGTTATLNSVTSARSAASSQTYDIRTVQTDAASNPLILRNGWGIVKDVDAPWNYKCGLAHIGMGNDIPEFTIDLGKGNSHVYEKHYPTPYIVSAKNVPECNFSVPARAALKQYKVYTPVETKVVSGASGLASFSTYYGYYHVQDYFLENDELVDTYCSRDNYAFGGEYLLMQTWYAQERQGWLLAATQYRGTNIWDGYKDFTENSYWGRQDKKVELRILDGVGSGYWPKHNELQPVLFNDETADHTSDRLTIYGSSNQEATGRPNQILYSGTRNGAPAMNFYCLPAATTKAKMANKTAYLQRQKCTYAQYLAAQSSVKENGDMLIFSNGEDGEAVGIDMVENSASFSNYEDGAFYTISGQKVSTPTKGLYIHNGKKVLVK